MSASGATNHCLASAMMDVIRHHSTFGLRLSNCWLTAATWTEALTNKSHHVDPSIKLDARKFNVAMSQSKLFKASMLRFDGSNSTGLFRVEYKHQFYYYLTAPTQQAVYLLLSLAWKERVLEKADGILEIPRTRARPSADDAGDNHDENLEAEASPQKRQREEIQLVHEETNLVEEELPPPLSSTSSYWPDSPKAHWLFQPRTCDSVDGNMTSVETPREAVERRIELLSKVQEREDTWKTVVKGHDPDNILCTKTEIFEIRQRAAFLCCAYRFALEKMNQWTWHQMLHRGMQHNECIRIQASFLFQNYCSMEHSVSKV